MTTTTTPEATVRSAARPRRTKHNWYQIGGNAVLYVVLSLIALGFIGPFLILLSSALKPLSQDLFGFPPDLIPRPPTLDSFREAFRAVPLMKYMTNSVIYAVTIVPISAMVCLLAGYAFGALRFPGRNLWFLMILGTMFLPAEVMLIPRYLVASDLGITNGYLGVILPSLLSAFGTLIMRQAFAGVPHELREAARIDGANEWQIFSRVMLPIVRPSLAIVMIFGFVNVWNSFLWPLVVLNDESKYPIALGIAYLAGIGSSDERSLAAGSVASIIPIVIVFLFLQRQILDGMKGAVKG